MGGKDSHIIDPNSPIKNKHQGGTVPSKNTENDNMLQLIKEAFRNCSVQGVLNKDKFNQALSILEALGFKRLRDTPLADRLFYIFDANRTGTILENEFIRGISDIISDDENAIKYTFRAFDKDQDNRISRRQFMQFIEESWKAAFRLLSEGIDQKSQGVKIAHIESWTSSKISLLNEESSRLFNRISNGSDTADYQSFRNFISRRELNDITAVLDNQTAMVPLTLTNLH